MREEAEKHMANISIAATKALEEKGSKLSSYHDMAIRNVPFPHSIDPRVLARECIRVGQFIVNMLGDNPFRSFSLTEVLKQFNEAASGTVGNADKERRRIRLVQKLPNKSFLGGFLCNEGAKWFSTSNHADEFIATLGIEGLDALVKRHNHPMIVHYIPLNLSTDNPAHLAEIIESNNLQEGDLLKIR